MAKFKPITIGNWQTGIADSPHDGFGDMRNIDFESIPGIAQIKRKLEKKSSTTVTNLPKWSAIDQANKVYVLDQDHKLYISTDSGASWSLVTHSSASTGTGNGLVIWKDALFEIGNAAIDVYYPLSGSPTWTNAWKSITSETSWHPAMVAQDDTVYIGCGRDLASLQEVAGQNFDPTNAATYTFQSSVLDLPEDFKIKSLEQNDIWLNIGTWKGTNIYDFNIGDIFVWDLTTQPSSFQSQITVRENGCNSMFNKDNDVYVFAGIDGRVYGVNGNYLELLRTLPFNLQSGSWVQVYPDAVENFDGRLIFGVSAGSGTLTNGVFGLGTRQGEIKLSFSHEYTISTGTNESVSIGTIKQINANQIIVGWKDGSNYGVDLLNASTVMGSYGAFIDSQFYDLASNRDTGVVSEIEIRLADDLLTGEGIRIKYRTALDDAFTTVGTFDFATDGAVNSKIFGVSFGAEKLQLRIEMTGSSTSPKLKQVIVR